MFASSKAGACFVRVPNSPTAPRQQHGAAGDGERPYYAYALAAQRFYPEPALAEGVFPKATVAQERYALVKGVRIDPGAVIGEHVELGDHVRIGANTVIGGNVQITGSHSHIGAACGYIEAIASWATASSCIAASISARDGFRNFCASGKKACSK